MITEERYNQLCSILTQEGFNEALTVDFESIKGLWDEMLDININKSQIANEDSDSLQLGYLFSLRWGITAIAAANKEPKILQMAFHGLFLSISNTILAIVKLALDGFDYQASVLLRNLYELCFTLLAVIIDPDKREALINGLGSEHEYNTWSKHFRFKELDKTIRTYENKIASEKSITPIEPDSFFNTWRKNQYSNLSSYAHNDFTSFFTYSYALPEDDGKLIMNSWGHFSSRVDIIMENMNSLLWYTEILFIRLLSDKNLALTNEDLSKGESAEELWNLASFIGILAKEYNIQISKEKSPE